MSQWRLCKRREFIRRLKKLGFDGLYSGGKHQFMVFKQHRLAVPSNPEYSVSQLLMMLHEVERILERKISAEEWNKIDNSV